MQRIRREEQRTAATLGKYNLQLQLAHHERRREGPGNRRRRRPRRDFQRLPPVGRLSAPAR